MRVRVNSIYRYNPVGWDVFRKCLGNTLTPGQLVRVINLPGAPPANTMGQCYVAILKRESLFAWFRLPPWSVRDESCLVCYLESRSSYAAWSLLGNPADIGMATSRGTFTTA
jgi:hypothetical protein